MQFLDGSNEARQKLFRASPELYGVLTRYYDAA